MRNFLYVFCFFGLFFSTNLTLVCPPENYFFADIYNHLPMWCSPTYFFHDVDDPAISVTKDAAGHLTQLSYGDSKNGQNIFITWNEQEGSWYISSVYIEERDLQHDFLYHESTKSCLHTMRGNLCGDFQKEDSYWRRGFFDDAFHLIRIEEEDGLVLKISPDKGEVEGVFINGYKEVYSASIVDSMKEDRIVYGNAITWTRKSTLDSERYVRYIGVTDLEGKEHLLRKEFWKKSLEGDVFERVVDSDDAGIDAPYEYPKNFEKEILERIGCVNFEKMEEIFSKPVSILNTGRGDPWCIHYANGVTKTIRYAKNGAISSIQFPKGATLTYTYDEARHVAREVYVPQHSKKSYVREYTYENKFFTAIQDSLGYLYKFTRDLYGRIVHVDVLQGSDTIQSYDLSYDALSRCCSFQERIHNAMCITYTYEPDQYHRKTVMGDESFVETFSRDGRKISEEIQGFVLMYGDDERVETVILNGRTILTNTYETTPDGVCQTSVFPEKGSLVEHRFVSRGDFLRQWIDLNGRIRLCEELISDADGMGKTFLKISGDEKEYMRWRYDQQGHIQEINFSDGRRTVFTYDAAGRCVEKRNSNGMGIHFSYDACGRLLAMYSSDGSLRYEYTYDEFGRIVEAHDMIRGARTYRSFDPKGRLCSDGEDAYRIFCAYGNDDTMVSMEYPDHALVQYIDSGVQISHKEDTFFFGVPAVEKKTCMYNQSDLFGQQLTEVEQMPMFTPFGKPVHLDSIASFDSEGQCTVYKSEQPRKYFYDSFGRLSKTVADGHIEEYRYDGFDRMVEIILDGKKTHLLRFDEMDVGCVRDEVVVERCIVDPKTKKGIFLEKEGQKYALTHDQYGSIVTLKSFDTDESVHCSYTPFGKSSFIHDCEYGFCGKRYLPLAMVYDFGPRRYHPDIKRWLERDPLGVVDTIDDRIFCRNNPAVFSDRSGLFPVIVDFGHIGERLAETIQNAASNAYKTITFAKQPFDWLFEFRSYYEDLFFSLMSRSWLQMMGYNLDPTATGVFAGNPSPSKVRITMINGILNGSAEARRFAKYLSDFHGKTQVHFVYSATQGFASDLLRGLCSKVGFISPQAKALITLWRELIAEMGGLESDGVIWHYAHSLGAADTQVALQYMTDEEKKKIKVFAFGVLTFVRDPSCLRVDNYVSVHDGVPLMDTINYWKAFSTKDPHVHFLPSTTYPFMDHFITGQAYRSIIQVLGQQFQEEYLRE